MAFFLRIGFFFMVYHFWDHIVTHTALGNFAVARVAPVVVDQLCIEVAGHRELRRLRAHDRIAS